MTISALLEIAVLRVPLVDAVSPAAAGVGRYTPAMKGGLCLLQKRSILPIQSTKLSANSSWRAFPITRNRPTPSRITACLSFGLKRIRLSLEIANHPLAPTLCNQTSSGVDSSENSSSCFTTLRPAFDKMRGNNAPRSRSVKNITATQLVRRLPLLLLPKSPNYSPPLFLPLSHPHLYGQRSSTWILHDARLLAYQTLPKDPRQLPCQSYRMETSERVYSPRLLRCASNIPEAQA